MYTKVLTENILDWKDSLQNLADIKVNQPFTLMKRNIHYCLTWLNNTSTSVRSEEIFSVAGNVLTEKRNRLLPENLDKLVFLHENH